MIKAGMSRKAQVAVYVIIALVIVGLIATFFLMRGTLFAESIPAELSPAFSYYSQCIEAEARDAISLAGSQGGHVYAGAYLPGSDYAPFSSQLNFLGFPVPYWFYVSGNGLVKENVPTKSGMQDEISQYIVAKVNENCRLDALSAMGFSIDLGTPTIKTTISDASVEIDVSARVTATKGESSATKTTHSVKIASRLGSLYNTAQSIYNAQRNGAILENYSVDVMRLYAPVDGVEISCSGKIWKTREVVDGIKSGLEANIPSIKFKGDYYTLSSKEESYFVVDEVPVTGSVNLLYSKNWPSKITVYGADDELMVAEPMGTQAGMNTMGFCYAQYHFVYDISFPVMIQVMDGQEVFQFPVVVIIDKNMPRKAVLSELTAAEPEMPDVCQFNTQDLEVNVYDSELNKVDANLTYMCFTQKCRIGSTVDGKFTGMVPACVNGYLITKAEGYAEEKQLLSTNEESSADVILDREYDIKVNLEVGGKPLVGTAMITINGERSVSAFLPDSASIKMSEGLYNVTVYAYGNSTITIPSSKKEQCTEIPAEGVLGIFGSTREECIDITIPETKIDSVLTGGGKSEIYVLPSDLKKGEITLRVDALPTPKSLEELQDNFMAFDGMGVELAI
jgi:hypothetical protein